MATGQKELRTIPLSSRKFGKNGRECQAEIVEHKAQGENSPGQED